MMFSYSMLYFAFLTSNFILIYGQLYYSVFVRLKSTASLVFDSRPENYWWKGQNKRTTEVGQFPRHCVDPLRKLASQQLQSVSVSFVSFQSQCFQTNPCNSISPCQQEWVSFLKILEHGNVHSGQSQSEKNLKYHKSFLFIQITYYLCIYLTNELQLKQDTTHVILFYVMILCTS